MDPLSALAIAAAVVQFVDYSGRLLSKSMALYRGLSGQEKRIVGLTRISNELRHLSDAIIEKTSQLTDIGGALSANDHAILELSNRARALCHSVSDLVHDIEGTGVREVDFSADKPATWGLPDQDGNHGDMGHKASKLQSFRGAAVKVLKRKVKSRTSEGRLDELENRIKDIKNDLMGVMIARLWEDSMSNETSTLGKQLEARRTPALFNELGSGNHEKAEHAEVIKSVFSLQSDHATASTSRHPLHTGQIRGAVWVVMSDSDCQKAILASLDDATLHTREVDIHETYNHTFKWIFDTPPPDPHSPTTLLWADYRRWLQSSSDTLYWITGKPGSGKSTMMKFIAGHRETDSHLQKWSPQHPILSATFYSWNAGSQLQKSLEGLLRTLLHQIISKNPSLAPEVFPDRWAMLRLFGGMSLPAWTCEELLASLSSLPKRTFACGKYSLVIFIDGLDEFNEVNDSHDYLIQLIQQLKDLPNTKICVSSRPWTAFKDAFKNRSQLRMEDITAKDVEAFVHGKLHENEGFRELRDENPARANELITTIVEKAEGVFLWVDVVTRTLLTGLSDGDHLPELQALLEDIPSDLMDLYTRLWQRIKPERKRHGAKLVLLFHTYLNTPQIRTVSEEVYNKGRKIRDYASVDKPKMSPRSMWIADEGPWTVRPEDQPHESYIISNLTRRLDSRTRGLLTIKRHDEIDYLHRTAKDWIQSTLLPEIVCDTPADFDPHLNLLKWRVSEITQTSCWHTGTNFGTSLGTALEPAEIYIDSWRYLGQCFYHVCRLRNNPANYPQIIEVVDSLETRLRSVINGREVGLFRPLWMGETALSGGTKTGFLSLAARMGAAAYVVAKVTSDPASYLPLLPRDNVRSKDDLVDPEYSVLFSLALGTGHAISSREYKIAVKAMNQNEKALFHALLKVMSDCYKLRTENDDALKAGRYEALVDIVGTPDIKLASTTSPGAVPDIPPTTRARIRKELGRLYAELERGTTTGQGKKGPVNAFQCYYDKEIDMVKNGSEAGDQLVTRTSTTASISKPATVSRLRYRLAVLKLLESYGVTGSSSFTNRVTKIMRRSSAGSSLLGKDSSLAYERWLRGEKLEQ
ncbi:hypothetical protein V8F06_006170 [Rhypophila decipiens]